MGTAPGRVRANVGFAHAGSGSCCRRRRHDVHPPSTSLPPLQWARSTSRPPAPTARPAHPDQTHGPTALQPIAQPQPPTPPPPHAAAPQLPHDAPTPPHAANPPPHASRTALVSVPPPPHAAPSRRHLNALFPPDAPPPLTPTPNSMTPFPPAGIYNPLTPPTHHPTAPTAPAWRLIARSPHAATLPPHSPP